jgi:Zn finger protein HypA/HybF involved in hydrogenase expression
MLFLGGEMESYKMFFISKGGDMDRLKSFVQVRCKSCNSNFKVEDEKYFGETSSCPNCKSEIYIPLPEPENKAETFTTEKDYNAKTRCRFCKEIILADAIKCKHCGEFLNSKIRTGGKELNSGKKIDSDLLGFLGLLLPGVSSIIAYAWVSQMRLIDNPSATLILIATLTVLITSLLFATEALLLGTGSPDDINKVGPIGWFLFCTFIWSIGFPTYLYYRSYYGMKNFLVGGILIMLIFLGTMFLLNTSIEEAKINVIAKMEKIDAEMKKNQEEAQKIMERIQKEINY